MTLFFIICCTFRKLNSILTLGFEIQLLNLVKIPIHFFMRKESLVHFLVQFWMQYVQVSEWIKFFFFFFNNFTHVFEDVKLNLLFKVQIYSKQKCFPVFANVWLNGTNKPNTERQQQCIVVKCQRIILYWTLTFAKDFISD